MSSQLQSVEAHRQTIRDQLLDAGVFHQQKIAVVGDGPLARDILAIVAREGRDIVVFSQSSRVGLGLPAGPRCLPLSVSAIRGEVDSIRQCQAVVVLTCDTSILEALLMVAAPFARITVAGPISGTMDDLDLYGTVHYKNLSLVFLPLLGFE